jgi:hypothetical protein
MLFEVSESRVQGPEWSLGDGEILNNEYRTFEHSNTRSNYRIMK